MEKFEIPKVGDKMMVEGVPMRVLGIGWSEDPTYPILKISFVVQNPAMVETNSPKVE